MKHKSISLPEADWKELAKAAKGNGISIGELVRRIINAWSKRNGQK